MIPDKYRVICDLCRDTQHPLDVRDNGVYQHTSGWVMNRDGGGGHAVSLPKRDHRWAHRLCVERMIKGTFDQARMF